MSLKWSEAEIGFEKYLVAQEEDYRVSWRNIIFLPFTNLWQLIIIFAVVIQSSLMMYDIVYGTPADVQTAVNFLFYLTEILYFIDTSLFIAHKNMPVYRRLREHKPKNMMLILMDVMSLLPVYEVNLLLAAASNVKKETSRTRTAARHTKLLRMYRLYEYFIRKGRNVESNHIVIVTFSHFLYFLALAQFLSSVWYNIACWDCAEPNWKQILKANMKFDNASSLDWVLISFPIISSVLANNWRGQIRGETNLERWILIVAMLVGFFMHMMVYFGRLTGAYIKQFRTQHAFVENLNDINNRLMRTMIDNELKTKTTEYYNVLWHMRSGIKTAPDMFEILPGPLQKEITLDIFWEALRHSHFFGDEDIAFKRALSLVMKNEFLLPGDYVYKMGEIKYHMVYIVSGVIQVLTSEDDESPIISFSSGTVLGEMACIWPTKSIAYVQCATYCEVQSLSLFALHTVLKNFPHKVKYIHDHLKRRIRFSYEVHAFKEEQQRIESVCFGYSKQEASIKWIKTQWRHLADLKRVAKRAKADVHVDPTHISRYLDLLVLSEEVELRMQVICLRGTCPFVLEPGSSFRKFIAYLVLAAVVLQSLLLPYIIAFLRRISQTMHVVFFFLDMIYFIDIYVKLSTAIKAKNVLISNNIEIIFWKFKDIYFLVNVLATIPGDYVALATNATDHVVALLKINRPLKIIEVVRFIARTETNIWVNSLASRICKHLMIYVVGCYWFGCLEYAVTCFYEQCNPDGWLYNWRDSVPFLRSMLYAISSFMQMGCSNNFETLIPEFLVQFCIVMIGYYFFTYSYSQLCATYILHSEREQCYRDYFSGMKEFFKRNKIPARLKAKMSDVLLFAWYYNKNVKIFGDGGILEDASDELKNCLIGYRIKDCLTKLPLFLDVDEETIDRLINVAEIRTLPPDTILLSSDVRPMWLHIVLNGYCMMESIMPGDRDRQSKIILGPGNAYPAPELLHQVNSLTRVTSLTAVEIISIKYYELQEIILHNPVVGESIKEALDQHFHQFEAELMRKKGRLPEMIPAEHSLGQGDMFAYDIPDDREQNLADRMFLKPFEELGKWGFVRHFMLRKTIDPQNKLFIIWDVIKTIFAMIRFFLAMTYFNVLIEYRLVPDILVHISEVICVVDFYIRMHCRYYNKKGILVTHPLYTANHYFKTSFVVDFFSMMPFRLLKIHMLFGQSKAELVDNILVIISRPLQLHRLISGINYVQSDISQTVAVLQSMKYGIGIVILLGATTVFVQLITCTIYPVDEQGNAKVECPDETWIMHTYYRATPTPINVYVQCLHLVVTLFTSSPCGNFAMKNPAEVVIFLLIYIVFFLVRWLVMAKIISYRVGGNTRSTIYQERLKSFRDFIKDELVDEELIETVVSNYGYHWRMAQDDNIVNSMKEILHPHLHKNVSYHLYGPTLDQVEAFQGVDHTFHRHVGFCIKLQHYRKDTEIIRCNDVQGLIYIIYKGKVDIIAAGMKLATLGRGGMFGCLEHCPQTRQTITAVAKVHVELLMIHNNEFYPIANMYKVISQNMQQVLFTHSEYVDSKRKVAFGGEMSSSSAKIRVSATSSVISGSVMKFYQKLNFVMDHQSSWYKLWHYVLNVHMASINSIVLMVHIVILGTGQEVLSKTLAYTIIYSFDVFFVVNMFMRLHLSFTDPESGIKIKDLQTIRRRYLRSFVFLLDVLTCFPFDLVTHCITTDMRVMRFAMSNRIFRFLHLLMYYSRRKAKLDVPTHLRWTYLLYMCSISVQFMTCLWWLSACLEGFCYYNEASFIRWDVKLLKAKPGLDSIMLAYTYVVNLFTSTSMKDVGPTTLTQIMISILIMIASQFILAVLSGEFVTLLAVGQYVMNDYEHRLLRLRTHLQNCELSPPITDKTWDYCLKLWQLQHGEALPLIISELPAYLKQDTMLALYGHHLRSHFLFENVHVDFLRQLIVHLKRHVYFPGNLLVNIGDMDGSMYFVHRGEVEVFEKHGNNENLREVVGRGQSFGEAQGLYNTPHELTYKAKTYVDGLMLNYKDWSYLLEWFPASSQEIWRRAARHRLKKNPTYYDDYIRCSSV